MEQEQNTDHVDIQSYVAESNGRRGVGLLFIDPGIIEHEGELCPGVWMTAKAARQLAIDLLTHAQETEEDDD